MPPLKHAERQGQPGDGRDKHNGVDQLKSCQTEWIDAVKLQLIN